MYIPSTVSLCTSHRGLAPQPLSVVLNMTIGSWCGHCNTWFRHEVSHCQCCDCILKMHNGDDFLTLLHLITISPGITSIAKRLCREVNNNVNKRFDQCAPLCCMQSSFPLLHLLHWQTCSTEVEYCKGCWGCPNYIHKWSQWWNSPKIDTGLLIHGNRIPIVSHPNPWFLSSSVL